MVPAAKTAQSGENHFRTGEKEDDSMEHTGLPHDHGEEQNHTAAMRELLRDEGHFQRIADIFRQLGDPSRIRIFWLLCHCEECVVNIAAMVEMSSPAVSHHLRVAEGQRPAGQPPGRAGGVLPRRRRSPEPPAPRDDRAGDGRGLPPVAGGGGAGEDHPGDPRPPDGAHGASG